MILVYLHYYAGFLSVLTYYAGFLIVFKVIYEVFVSKWIEVSTS